MDAPSLVAADPARLSCGADELQSCLPGSDSNAPGDDAGPRAQFPSHALKRLQCLPHPFLLSVRENDFEVLAGGYGVRLCVTERGATMVPGK